jgi:hypothetical protein
MPGWHLEINQGSRIVAGSHGETQQLSLDSVVLVLFFVLFFVLSIWEKEIFITDSRLALMAERK